MASPAAGTRYFRVKNLNKYQHYRDRNPPWIKLHQSITEDTAFALLPDAAKGHLMLIWLLASRMDNRLPLDPVFIGARINARGLVDLNLLVERGFLTLEPLARRKRHASATPPNPEPPNRDIEQRTQRENGEKSSSSSGWRNGNGRAAGDEDSYVTAVLALYCRVPGARDRPTKADRKTAVAWAREGIPLGHVRAGILKAAVHREGRARETPLEPINSLAYFRDEIKAVPDDDPEYVEHLAARGAEFLKPETAPAGARRTG